jgi:DNA-binding NtrC family response regulator
MQNEREKRILILDFDNELLIQGQILLEDYGFDVTTTWSTREASDILSSQRFDLVLLGDYLPDAGARGLWSLLRKVPSSTGVAVIQSAHPTLPQISDLLRDHARYCALPRERPVQIADRVAQCLQQPRESRSTTFSKRLKQKMENDSAR